MDAVERKIQRQIWLSILNGAAYALWQGAELTYFQHAAWKAAASNGGMLLWFVTVAVLLWPLRRVLMRKGQCEPGDERIRRNGMRSIAATYYCLIVAIAAFMMITLLTHVESIDVVRMLAIVGVATPAIAFGIMEALDGRG